MTRVVTIAGTALTSVTQLESIIVGGQASYGSSTLSEVIIYDETNALFGTAEHFVRKQWSVTEDASGTAVYLARGRIAAFETHRGEDDSIMGTKVQYTFALEDQNLELRGHDVHNWVRPAETDYARVTALGTAYLNGSPRSSTNLNTTTYVPNTNTVSLPAKTYYNTDVYDVLSEIATAADKMFFVTVDHELYYDLQAGTAYVAGLEISDGVGSAAAPDGTNYFAPIWDTGPALSWEGQEYASRIRYAYNQDYSILSTDASSEALHDIWVTRLYDNATTTASMGTAIANSELAYRKVGERSYSLSLKIPAAQAYKIKVGQMVWVQTQAAVDTTTRTRRRIAEIKWEPAGPAWYMAHLTLDLPIRARRRRSMTGAPQTGPKPAPASIPDAAGTAVYSWSFDADALDDAYSTYDSGLAWKSTYWAPADAAFGAGYGANNASHFESDQIPLSALTEYIFSCDAIWEFDPSVRGATIQWRDGSSVLRTDTFINGALYGTGTEYHPSVTLTSPTGTVEAIIKWSKFAGFYADNLAISTVGTVYDDDPYALENPGTSPYYARSDDPRFDAVDQHETTRISRTMTNASGTALADGDIVVLNTASDNSVTRTTTASYTAGRVGIVLTGGSATADVLVALEGVGAYAPNLNGGSAIAGYYLYTSTTAGAASFSATRTTGAFGRIVTASAGDPVTVDLWGVPDSGEGTGTSLTPSGSVSNIATTPGFLHQPGVAKLDADHLVLVYRAGTDHDTTQDGKIVYRIGTIGTDYAVSWSAQADVYDDPSLDCRDSEVMVTSAGTVICSFFTWNGTTTYALKVVRATWNGSTLTWGSPIAVSTSYSVAVASSAKAVELFNGDLLLPFYGRASGSVNSCSTVKSTDDGLTWGSQVTIITGTVGSGDNWNEPYIVRLADGRLHCLIREDTDGRIYRTTSSDGGATWATATNVYGGDARPAHIQVQSGALLVVSRADPNGDTIYRISTDYGLSWSAEVVVDSSGTRNEYASIVQMDNYRYGVAYAIQNSSTDADIKWELFTDSANLDTIARLSSGSSSTDHGALTGLADDDHTQYLKESEFGAKGDLLVGTASGTLDNLAVGTDGYGVVADSAQTTGLRYGAFVGALMISDTPSTPLVFADILQNEAEDDLLYADP